MIRVSVYPRSSVSNKCCKNLINQQIAFISNCNGIVNKSNQLILHSFFAFQYENLFVSSWSCLFFIFFFSFLPLQKKKQSTIRDEVPFFLFRLFTFCEQNNRDVNNAKIFSCSARNEERKKKFSSTSLFVYIFEIFHLIQSS